MILGRFGEDFGVILGWLLVYFCAKSEDEGENGAGPPQEVEMEIQAQDPATGIAPEFSL